MEKLVVFRLKDDQSIYIADLDAGTIERSNGADEGMVSEMVTALEGRGTGPVVKGIDLAVAASLRTGASGHYLYPST